VSGFVVYVEQGAVKHKQFVSEKARDCFVRDFLLDSQNNDDSFVEFIGDGTISRAEEFYGKSEKEQEKREIKVGDMVRVIEDEQHFLKSLEIGKVVSVGENVVRIASINPSHCDGIWMTSLTNVELVNE